MIHTGLTELFGLTHPVLSAPMAGVAGAALASTVSEAGGLGFIGGGYGDETALARELEGMDASRIGIGFITWNLPAPSRALTLALESHPKAIFLSFGDPAPFLPEIAAAGNPPGPASADRGGCPPGR